MKRLKSNIVLHLLVALALSLVINFSYLLIPIITDYGMNQRGDDSIVGEHNMGELHIEPDLHGYIICDCSASDSTYVSAWQVRTHKLQDGDRLRFSSRPPEGELFTAEQINAAHPRLDKVYERNGEPFDFDTLYDRPSRTVEFVWQILYYTLLILVMLIILNWQTQSGVMTRWAYVRRLLLALLLTIIGIYFAPIVAMKGGVMRIVFFFESDPRNHAYLIVITKGLFIFMVSVLYSRIYLLIRQRQSMVVENERLKTEYLSTRYNMLVGQINPHFFFNSLNSLAMLVREKDDKRALEYIDQLSYTFRYIIQNGQSALTTLKDEMTFAEAYIYLFKIRYEDKLFFDIDIDESYMRWSLPALSLQPLIGNAVKHNSITTKNPLHVTIRVVDGVLEVENGKHPKLDVEPSTGIGLDNLQSRWQILAGKKIEIIDDNNRFLVRMPLMEPKA